MWVYSILGDAISMDMFHGESMNRYNDFPWGFIDEKINCGLIHMCLNDIS